MNTPTARKTGHRLWIPALIVLLVGGGLVAVAMQAELDRNFKSWGLAALSLLGGLLLLLWFLLLSRFSGRVRLLALVLVGGLGAVLSQVLTVDGTVDGTGLPNLTWVWNKKAERQFDTSPVTLAVEEISTPAGARDVPQFFGPDRTGVVVGAKLLADWTSKPPRELWRIPVGEGWSAFAVVGGRAYTQEQRGEEELTTCYELATGRLLWSRGHKARFTQWQGGTGPRATPTVHEKRVYSYGATGILSCFDAMSGTLLWSREVLKDHNLPNIEWGISASPLVYDDLVVVTGGDQFGPTVLAFDQGTGELRWKAGSAKACYASPQLVTLSGKRAVLSVNAGNLSAHDPATGEVLLNFEWGDPRWPKASQAVVVEGDRVFLSAGYGMGCTLLKITPAPDGKTLQAEEVWKNLRMKTQFNSTAIREGFIYGLDDGQIACLSVEDGRRQWKEGRYGSGQSLVVDDLALIQSEPGPVYLVKLGAEGPQEVGKLEALSAKTWNHPTLAGRYLLVRNSTEAVCYELPVVETP